MSICLIIFETSSSICVAQEQQNKLDLIFTRFIATDQKGYFVYLKKKKTQKCPIINGPCVDGAVLQTSLSLINYLIHSFICSVILQFRISRTLSIPNRMSWGAEILRKYSPSHPKLRLKAPVRTSSLRLACKGSLALQIIYQQRLVQDG